MSATVSTEHRHYLNAYSAGSSSGHPFSIRKESNWCFVLTLYPKKSDHGDGW
jgi:hypothetical protein